MSIQLGHYLVLSGVLFAIGAAGFLVRRNALVALMSIELMLNSVNLTFIAFNRWQAAAPVSRSRETAEGERTRAAQQAVVDQTPGRVAALRAAAERTREQAQAAERDEQAQRLREEAERIDAEVQRAEQAAASATATLAALPEDTRPMIPHHGQVFAFFVIAVAAAEAAVGLAIVLSLYRVRKTVRTDDADLLKG